MSEQTLQERLIICASDSMIIDHEGCMRQAADRIDELEKKCKQLDESESQLIQERDHWVEKATELASDVGGYFRVDVGEHSSANCPVEQAIAVINGEYVTDSDADRKYKGLAGITKRLIFSKFDLMRKVDELERQLAEVREDQDDAERFRFLLSEENLISAWISIGDPAFNIDKARIDIDALIKVKP